MTALYIVRQVNYFFGMKGHAFALVFEDRIVDIVDRSWGLHLDEPGLVGLIQKGPKTGGWGGAVAIPPSATTEDGYVSYVPHCRTKSQAAKACRVRARELRAEAERQETDPAYALDKALATHDWTAHYSDDNSVWLASERHWATIQTLLEKVPPDVGEVLMVKYRSPEQAQTSGKLVVRLGDMRAKGARGKVEASSGRRPGRRTT